MSESKGTFDRFRALEDATGAPLDAANTPLAGDDDSTFGLPFVRCAVCDVDGHRSARECAHCGADLTSAEQRAFLQAFAQERSAQERGRADELQALAASQRQALADASPTRLKESLEAQQTTADEDGPAIRISLGPGASYLLRAVGGVLLLISVIQALRGRFWLALPLFGVAVGCSVAVMWMRARGRT